MSDKPSLTSRSYSSLIVSTLILVSAFCISGVSPAIAQVQGFQNTSNMQITTHTLRKKAPPDECWAYLASPSPLPKYTDPLQCSTYPVPPGKPTPRPKVNQSYIWGLTESGDSLWWGTFVNANCVTQAGTVPSTTNPNGAPNAHVTDAWVCEFYDSPYYPSPFPDARIADARSPRAYQYSKSTQALIDRTPRYPAYVSAILNPEGIHPLLIATRGIRAALSINGLIILAGPALDPAKGLNIFAWDANTGAFLGARVVLGYNNIRQFLILNGVPYTAVGKNNCSGSPPVCTSTVTGGRILRVNPSIIPGCTFNPTPTIPSPLPCFLLNGGAPIVPAPPTEVGNLDTVAGALTAHNGRIYTVTWPHQDLPGVMASLYQSPPIPQGGLTPAEATSWTQLWKATDYEPDAAQAQFYAGGALASFDGYLWWGTLHVPMQPFLFLTKTYPPITKVEAFEDLLGTLRAGVFFRGKDLDTPNPKIDLVYGNERLPVFTPPGNGTPQMWTMVQNKMPNPKALWGPSGFGNIWNNYIWSATVWNNRLWVGTMDWSFSALQGNEYFSKLGIPNLPPEVFVTATFGSDLVYFTSASKPAFPESTNGVDNPTSYGVRNQLSSNNGNLFLGMANPMNLLTDPADPKHFGGLGGWELIELSPSPNVNTPVGTNVVVSLPGATITYCSVSNAGMTLSASVKNPYPTGQSVNGLLTPFNLDSPIMPVGVPSPPSKLTMLWTSALWGQGCSSPVLAAVSIPFSSDSDVVSPRLLQLQWDGAQYKWIDITTSVDFARGLVNGAVTADYLGILGVAQGPKPKLAASVTGKGFANRSFYVDLTITNVGDAPAKDTTLANLAFRTLTSPGTITYETALSPPLPRLIGDLQPGDHKVIRLYLKSTTGWGSGGVVRFVIWETINMNDVSGRGSYTNTLVQLVNPFL